MFKEIKGQWRVVLVTLLAANLVFMDLLQWQRLEIWRSEQEYFRRIQQPSTDKFDFLAKELAEAKKSETIYLDHIYRVMAEMNTRIARVEKATADTKAAVEEMSAAAKPN